MDHTSTITQSLLEERLADLENLYADYLTGDMDAKVLTPIWEEIKTLRNQLQIPIYSFVTPSDLRC